MVIFHNYVKLPEGTQKTTQKTKDAQKLGTSWKTWGFV
jgi:hypothetical protein